MKKILFIFALTAFALFVQAEEIKVNTLKYAGPYDMQKPFFIDETDVNAKKYSAETIIDTPLPLADVFDSEQSDIKGNDGIILPKSSAEHALHLLGFTIQNNRYGKAKLTVEGLKKYQLFVDGLKAGTDSIVFEPGTHQIVIKVLTTKNDAGKVKVIVATSKNGFMKLTDQKDGRNILLTDILHGKRFSGVSVSSDGKYLITNYTDTKPGGTTNYISTITEIVSGRIVAQGSEDWQWMPRSVKYYYFRSGQHGRELVTVDPQTGSETVLANQLPEGRAVMAPTEDYLLYMMRQEGPKERKDVYEVLVPDDRQPGWRNRSYLAKYDLKRHVLQQLTYGYRNMYLNDISQDGKCILFSVSTERLTKRPTTLQTVYCMNVNTLETEKLVDGDGFLSGSSFSPDAKQVLFQGTPESFNGVGKNVKPDQIPSMYDYQLYVMDIKNKEVKPLTKNFNPNVTNVEWSSADEKIYFMAENKDSVSLYRMEPNSWEISQVRVPEELVKGFTLAKNAPMMVYCGQGTHNSDRIYTMDLGNDKSSLIEDLSKDILNGITLGECKSWNFVNSRGDTIYGRYYLPADFNPAKQYPMVVDYYGGCSPTSRTFESRYPQHVYASMGYVVYVVNPSGATGFGQEFAARHVNTAGKGVADDIIEGVKKFTAEHSFINPKKIGCIGASYGGFMTQYLQTQTDIFAAAISHAGISDHTSYWGEGYWGYSYSEVSMANSYPWTRKDLYVDQSPLFNADKIHTPLLFLHGTADTNVPVGESIQMFTALKLLGRPTAFVLVDGQNHHILDYEKRIRWQNTIFAWFQKWLQDDDSWWEALYPTRTL
ncbi:MAG: prolyl oligopeptidase family serine peptidase [Bacteroidaceae bacterium]|nr:prolyl oligopeptidase family serine peptidase [Bacteroidaceae bacterium]